MADKLKKPEDNKDAKDGKSLSPAGGKPAEAKSTDVKPTLSVNPPDAVPKTTLSTQGKDAAAKPTLSVPPKDPTAAKSNENLAATATGTKPSLNPPPKSATAPTDAEKKTPADNAPKDNAPKKDEKKPEDKKK